MKKESAYCFKVFVLLLGMFLSFIEIHSQDPWTVDVMGSVKKEETKKRLMGATITIKRNGANWKTITTPENGKFDVSLLPNAVYLIEFSKPGHVTKKVEIDTRNVPEEDAKYGFDFPMEMNLFEKIEGLDVSILSKPIAKVKFDPALGLVGHDEEYTRSIKKELERLKRELAEKLKELEAERKAKQGEYDKAISSGDKAFNSEKWSEAKPFYEKAASIFEHETYPKDQLAEITAQLKKLEAGKKAYDDAIAKADEAFQKKDWSTATTAYQSASDMRKDEQYPKDKIKEIQEIIEKEKNAEKAYNDAITAADQSFSNKDYDKAREDYTKASGLKPDEQYPKDKIREIETILSDIEKKNKEYDEAIASGDSKFQEKSYQESMDSYKKAAEIRPEEKYPKDRIAEIESILAKEKEADKQYKEAIASADNFLKAKEYESAISSYKKASELKTSEQYPKDKIKEIETILADLAKTDQEYKDAIAEGDNQFKAKDYEKSKESYNTALSIKPEEQYPKDKIKEIEEILAKQKEADKEYNELIASGDQSFDSKNYEAAKESYNNALQLKPAEQYPKDRIKEIEDLMAGLAQKEKEYEETIKKADSKFESKAYQESIDLYNSALEIKPNEEYPKTKISEIETILAKEKELEEAYNSAIASADKYFEEKKYDQAKADYNKALGIKPEETYPKNKLKEIDNILAGAAESDKKFAEIITNADNEFNNKAYQKSIDLYNDALSIKPDEQYPKDRIDEAKKILDEMAQLEENYKKHIENADASFKNKEYAAAKSNYLQASKLKDAEQYPKDKIKEIEEILAKEQGVDKAYNEAIAVADQFLGDKDYDQAKENYMKASGLKPSEQYPKDKLEEINNILAEIDKKNAEEALAAESERKKKEYYNALIAEADAELLKKSYDNALSKYKQASDVIPSENYPKDKIKEIEGILAKLKEEEANAALAQKELDEKYANHIRIADNAMGSKDYEEAKENYTLALNIKSSEKYPKDQLDKIEKILSEEAKKNEEIKVTNNALKQKRKLYESHIKKADQEFDKERYQEARSSYQLALGIMPDEEYPKNRIEEIDKILDDIAKKEQSDKARLQEEKEKREKYEKFIYDGDRAMRLKKYESARENFESALSLYAEEEYPKKKLAEIKDLLSRRNDEPKEVASNSNSNVSRVKITDDNERKIEERMLALKNKRNREREASLNEDKKDYENQNELRVSGGIERTKEADTQKEEYRAGILALSEKGEVFHKDNAEEIKVTVDELSARSKERVNEADGRVRANLEGIGGIISEKKKNEEEYSRRNREREFDVSAYRSELVQLEKSRISSAENKRAGAKEDLKNISDDRKKMAEENIDHYMAKTVELVKFRENVREREQKVIERADNNRAANVKKKEELHADMQEMMRKRDGGYLKNSKQIEDTKKDLLNQEKKTQKEADQRRNKAGQDIVRIQEDREAFYEERDGRYFEFKEKLNAEKQRNSEFIADLATLEANKIRVAKENLSRFDKPKKKYSENEELLKKYPQGITEETSESGNSITIKRIKVTGTHVDVYERVFYDWGGTYYYKNGLNITKTLWDKESIEK